MAVTTKKLFPATSNATTTVFSPVGIQLNNQDDLDVYVTLSGGTRVLQLRQSTGSTAQSSHPQVNNTDGLYFPAVSAGTTLYNYTLSSDNNTITFNSALPQGAVVFCERRTRDADSAYTSFASGSTIRATDLNNSSTESNFTAQDARNKALDLEGSIFGGIQPSISGVAQPFVNSAKIIDGSIATADIADDAITSAKIADDAIQEAAIGDNAIRTNHIFDGQVTTGKIADDAVTTARIADNAVTGAKFANNSITTAKLNDSAVTTAKLADNAVTTAKILNGNITADKLAGSSVTNSKIANDAVTTAKIGDDTISTALIQDSAVTTAKIADDAIDNSKIGDNAVRTAHIFAGQVTTDKIADSAITTARIASNAVTTDKIADSELTTLAGMQSTTASNLASSTALTATTAELNQLDGITLETSLTSSDARIPTSKAVNDQILAVTNALGGFVAIADETSFPATNPDPSNGAGTVVSISQVSSGSAISINNSGVATISNGAGTGNTVTITGFPTTLRNTSLAASSGLQVQTTTTLHTYTFHKQLASAADIAAISATVNSFSNRYRVSSSAPTSSLDSGDLWYDTSNSKLMVYSGQNSAWEEATAIGNFFISTLSSSSNTGGGSATPNGTAYRFTISNAPTNAQQLIVSVDGVIQKPNAGSSQPSEGFVLVGNDIIFGSAPANGASIFVTVIGSTVGIGTPSNNTVTTAILQNGSVTTAKIVDANVTNAKLADGSITTAKIAAGQVTLDKLADNSINTDRLIDANVTTAKIADSAVTTAKIGNSAITEDKLGAASVITTKLNDSAVTSTKIANNAVTEPRIADQAVTLAKLEHGTSSNDGKFLRANNGADPTFESIPSGITINNQGDNRVITGTGTTDTLNSESNLIFDSSGRLLIGGTSIGSASSYYDDVVISNTASGGGAGVTLIAATDGFNAIDFADTAAGGRGRITYGHDVDRMMIDVGGNEAMRIVSDGKIGIGTSSPATLLNLDVDTEANLGSGSEGIRLTSGSSNAQLVRLGSSYSNGSVTGPGTLLYSSNKLSLRCDNSNPITFHTGSTVAERMRLTATGRLGIGTTSPDHIFEVEDNNSSVAVSRTGANAQLLFKSNSVSQAGQIQVSESSGGGVFQIFNKDTSGNLLERMRIAANGDIGIGDSATNPQHNLHVRQNGFADIKIENIANQGECALTMLGKTSTGVVRTFMLKYDAGDNVRIATPSAIPMNFETSDQLRMKISAGGNIGAPSGSNIYNVSDRRLKKNIATLDKGLTSINALRPVSFNWIEGFCDEEKDTLYGFIAQEVKTVDPNLVQQFGADGTVEVNGKVIEDTIRVNEKLVIPMLVKAVQELSAKVETLETRIAKLEAA